MHLPQVTKNVLQFYVGMLRSCLFNLYIESETLEVTWRCNVHKQKTFESKQRSKTKLATFLQPDSLSCGKNKQRPFWNRQKLTACVLPDRFTWNACSVLVQCGLGQSQQPPSSTTVYVHVLSLKSTRDRVIVWMYSWVPYVPIILVHGCPAPNGGRCVSTSKV